MKIRIELKSDTCVSSGESVLGIIDTEVVFDKYGIPIIQGKRIKGLLLEASKDLLDLGLTTQNNIDEVFGKSGSNEFQNVYFNDATIIGYSNFYENIKKIKNNENYKILANENNLKDYFTYIRTQTKIGKDGVAETNSLRNIRVIKKGFIFEADIDINQDISQESKDLLKKAAKIIRHIGVSRTRGLGEIKCEIIDKTSNNKINNVKLNENKDNILTYKIKLKQPCVIDESYIPGGVILGIFAGSYLRKTKGVSSKNAHNDENFKRLFLSNSVVYECAYPSVDDEVFYPMPLSILKNKYQDNGDIIDLAAYDLSDIDAIDILDNKQKMGEEFALISDEGEILKTLNVEKEIIYHHKRSTDRTIGHVLKDDDANNTDKGQLFNYQSIVKETEFIGRIKGNPKDIELLKNLIPDGSKIHIGRSKSAQYGLAKINYIYNQEVETEEIDDKIVITLQSPMILLNEFGMDVTDLKMVAKEVLKQDIDDDDIYCYGDLINTGGYNAKWNMPKEQHTAIKQGSVIVVNNIEIDEEEANKLQNQYYGEKINEGYGKISINKHGEYDKFSYEYYKEYNIDSLDSIAKISKDKELSKYLKYQYKNILEEVLYTYNDNPYNKNIYKILNGIKKNTIISNVIMMAKTSSNFKDLSDQLDKAIERSNKKNSECYNDIKICITDRIDKDIEKEFTNFANDEINSIKNIPVDLINELRNTLNENKFDLFKGWFINILNTVKLNRRSMERGEYNE